MIEYFHPDPEELQSLKAGPLSPHLDAFAVLLSRQRYCARNGWQKVQLVADLSCWMARKRLQLQDLDEQRVATFLETRWRKTPRQSGDKVTMTALLRQLREARAVPLPSAPMPSPVDLIQRDFGTFLLQERGLTQASVGQYLPVAGRFVHHRFPSGNIRLKKLCANDVTDFVLHDTSERGRRSAQLTTTVLRSFLNFLFRDGRIAVKLAAAVPTVAGWRLSELPRFLEAAEVEKVLRSCDRRRKTGKRDYAILLLLARLGLRAGEAARLSLDDINWDAGELCVHGKGARVDRLPLLSDVGQAVADYLHKGRPACVSRQIFIQSKAPYEGIAGPSSIDGIVRRALSRARLHPRHQGAHLLRHSLATRMLGSGASLAQVGQVLRHQQAQTTEIYAKVHVTALRALAQPWPGGVRCAR